MSTHGYGARFTMTDSELKKRIKQEVDNILQNKYKEAKDILYWDGNASKRIVNILKREVDQTFKI